MTDPTGPSRGRIDLRAIDTDGGAADRVIADAMQEIRLNRSRATRDPFADVDRYLRPALLAAAVLAALAAGIVATTNRRPPSDTPAMITTVASWVETQHVPTNSELLVAFKGYR
jgi:hypothetical protein